MSTSRVEEGLAVPRRGSPPGRYPFPMTRPGLFQARCRGCRGWRRRSTERASEEEEASTRLVEDLDGGAVQAFVRLQGRPAEQIVSRRSGPESVGQNGFSREHNCPGAAAAAAGDRTFDGAGTGHAVKMVHLEDEGFGGAVVQPQKSTICSGKGRHHEGLGAALRRSLCPRQPGLAVRAAQDEARILWPEGRT